MNMAQSTLLDAILAPGGLRMSLQPIFDVSGAAQRVSAVECLARGPAGTNLERANVLFEYVRRKKEETAVDRACVLAGLSVASSLPSSIDIDLNVHASTLGRDPGFVSFLESAAESLGISPARVVVEIVEHFPYWDSVAFFDSLSAIRAAGMRVALDDVGAGNSNFSMMIDVEPDFLKIDRYLIRGCDSHAYRRVVLESVHHLASRTGARLVAEGVETVEELETLTSIGIELIQGYLLSPNRTRDELMSSGILEPQPPSWIRPTIH
jgi:EAL domain-containing protein (putative c-di-GMP-specific phosphodiesterase class I)